MVKVDVTTGSKSVEVQRITEKDFNEMDDSKKQFLQGLIERGQVMIVSDDEKQRVYCESFVSPFGLLHGKIIEVVLDNGEIIEGKLFATWQFEIGILVNKKLIIILKHAIQKFSEK